MVELSHALKVLRTMPKTLATKTKTTSGPQGAKVPEFEAKVLDLSKVSALKPLPGSVVVGVYQDGILSEAAQTINKITDGAIKAAQSLGDITGKKATLTVLRQLPSIKNIRVVVVGLGKAADLNAKSYLSSVHAATKAISLLPESACVWTLHDIKVPERDEHWASAQAAQSFVEAGYKFDQCKGVATQSEPAEAVGPSAVVFASNKASAHKLQLGIQTGLSIGLGANLAKDLGNLPGNICTPTYLAETAKKIAKEYKLDVDVLEQRQMQALGMGS
jgi:leucyl aminopeptidase